MADIDLERAKKLIKSAGKLYKSGDFPGVAGLAYQAFESAVMAMDREADKPYHEKRRKKAKALLSKFGEEIDMLWEMRNIDFYGSVKHGYEKRQIKPEEAKRVLDVVGEIVRQTERMMLE